MEIVLSRLEQMSVSEPTNIKVQPADVLTVRTSGWASTAIRFGAFISHEPDLDNHVVVVHHVTQKAGFPDVIWGIEGKPGGVGWVDCQKYLNSHWTVTNAQQPKTLGQRTLVCTAMQAAIGTPYDWEGIEHDTIDAVTAALDLPELFANKDKWDGKVPGHVVCSSVAAWGYSKGGLARPTTHQMRETTPGDWELFIINRTWEITKP
jgi:hypothetical protein